MARDILGGVLVGKQAGQSKDMLVEFVDKLEGMNQSFAQFLVL